MSELQFLRQPAAELKGVSIDYELMHQFSRTLSVNSFFVASALCLIGTDSFQQYTELLDYNPS
jgi:hypothetical protein